MRIGKRQGTTYVDDPELAKKLNRPRIDATGLGLLCVVLGLVVPHALWLVAVGIVVIGIGLAVKTGS